MQCLKMFKSFENTVFFQSIRRGTNTFATKEEQLGKLELTVSSWGSWS